MNNLHRELAPISEAAWAEIEAEAQRVLKLKLAGRKLVDFVGPLGPEAAAVNIGRLQPLKGGPVAGVRAGRRQVLPLVELVTSFELARDEIDAVERGAADPDLQAVVAAATRIAQAEDTMIFHGWDGGGIAGIDDVSPHPVLPIAESYERYPRTVADAVRLLRLAGIDGPFGLALGPRCYTGVMQATAQGGYPILELIRKTIDGPLVWAPAVSGAVVLSVRGGDFELTVGRDLSIRYDGHDATRVRLALEETLAFRVLTPEAAVVLAYDESTKRKK